MLDALDSRSRTGPTIEQLTIYNEPHEGEVTLGTLIKPGTEHTIITFRAFG